MCGAEQSWAWCCMVLHGAARGHVSRETMYFALSVVKMFGSCGGNASDERGRASIVWTIKALYEIWLWFDDIVPYRGGSSELHCFVTGVIVVFATHSGHEFVTSNIHALRISLQVYELFQLYHYYISTR